MISIIPDINDLKGSVELAEKIGAQFEYNDFFKPNVLLDDDLFKSVIEQYKQLDRDRSKDTLHGAFFDIVLNSTDAGIRACSIDRVRKSMEAAAALSCRGVVFHTNYLTGFKSNSYRYKWVMDHAEFYTALAEEYRGINIYIENMFDDTPELLRRLCDSMKDVPNFGVCFDIAHANLWSMPLKGWIETLGPYIRHMHVNDNFGDEDSHMAVGEGSLNWQAMNDPIIQKAAPSVLIEVKSHDKALSSYEYLKANKIYPFTDF